MKKPLKIAGGLAALFVAFVAGSWWMVANSPDALGKRFVAALKDHEDGSVFEELLARGADPNYIDKIITITKPELKDRAVALVVGASYFTVDEEPPLLFMACAKGNEDAVLALLKYKADPNMTFQGTTPLKAAKYGGSASIVAMLTQAGTRK